ncbi:glycosyltransferase involved in cell wall biosynthesis [Bacilli bacterium PM5-9]|nr:glycosyltransferase involved in cell wall biosynthesis [Bacilli bacterium PM5-9]
MRIGIFTDTYTPEINGVATSVQQLENELVKHGHEVYIITSSSYRKITRNDNVIRMPGISLKKLYGYHVSGFYSWFGASYIKKLNLDLIHAHTEYGIGIFARIIATELSLPLVYTYHTMMEDYSHYVTKVTGGHFEKPVKKFLVASSRMFADRCTELIVPSQKTADAMLRYGVTNKINVIPTGIDLSSFSSNKFNDKQLEELREKYNIDSDDFLVVFVGRLAPEKSVDEIIEAFNVIKQENYKNIKLLIIGDGPSFEDIETMMNNYQLNEIVTLVGKIPYEKVPIYYQISDVFVSTSTTETQGLTFIEAMASHLPVICKYDKNLEDIVLNDETGFFISNVDELASKLIELSKVDQYEYNKYCTKAREIANNYSSTIFYEKVMLVYDNAIRSKRRQSFKAKKDPKRK